MIGLLNSEHLHYARRDRGSNHFAPGERVATKLKLHASARRTEADNF